MRIGLLALALLLAVPARAEERRPAGVWRGVTISCPMDGRIWGTPATREAMDALVSLGVETVAIHPYARVGTDGSVRFRSAIDTDYLRGAVANAQGAKLLLFLKPHLAYWGSFTWRGAIEFGEDEARWTRFMKEHEAWIVDQARFAEMAGLPLFAVGVELDRTLHREKEWRRTIAAVRAVYRGRITYAANWDAVERVPFWDALDYVGVQAYFPIAAGLEPSDGELAAGWRAATRSLEALSRRAGRPVIFTELGYNRSNEAASKPWDAKVDDDARTRRLRRRLMLAALDAVEAAPFVHAVYWWKWIPGWAPWDRDFSMRDEEAQDVLRGRWAPLRATGSSGR